MPRIGGNKAHESKDITLDKHAAIHPEEWHANPFDGNPKPVVSSSFKVTPATEVRVIEVANMICEGKSKKTCLEYIMSSQNVGIAMAKFYYQAALNWLVPTDLDEYKKGLIQANVERLETIIQEGLEKSVDAKRGADYLRTAKDAISELNKMLGIGLGSKVTVAQNQQGEQIVEINFQ